MEVRKIFNSNYLSKKKFSFGETFAVLYIAISIILSLTYWNNADYASLLAANFKQAVGMSEYWRLFTSTFVHADLKHFLSNLLMLYILFYFNAAFFGGVFTLVHTFIAGTIINYLTLSFYPPEVTLVGASGVVFYLWGFWLVLYLFIQTQYHIMSRFLRVGAIFFILLVPSSLDPQTSYSAHYIGFVLGLFSGGFYFLFNRKTLMGHERWNYEYIPDEDDFENDDMPLTSETNSFKIH